MQSAFVIKTVKKKAFKSTDTTITLNITSLPKLKKQHRAIFVIYGKDDTGLSPHH